MKVYNFVYNYGFLSDWMKANPEIKRGEILRSIITNNMKIMT